MKVRLEFDLERREGQNLSQLEVAQTLADHLASEFPHGFWPRDNSGYTVTNVTVVLENS